MKWREVVSNVATCVNIVNVKKMHQSFIILSLSLSPSLHRHPESSAKAEMNDSSCTNLLISISSAVEISSHPNNTPAPWSGSKIQDPGWAHAAPEDDEPGGDIYRNLSLTVSF